MIKKILNFLLNFAMSILVLGLIVVALISNTVLNKEYIKRKLEENRFYDRTYSDIKEDFENYTMQSGLELEILDGLFTKEKVVQDVNLKIDSIYNGKKGEVETASIRNELDLRINRALEENNRVPKEEEKASIQKYEDTIVDSYKSGILYGVNFSINGIYEKYLEKAKIACIVGIVVISAILLIINRNLLKYISFVGINLLFSGILSLSVKFLIEKRVQHILILDSKFSNFLVNSLNDLIEKCFQIGVVVIAVGFALIVLGSLEKLKKTIENKTD
ncbi:MAG: hypothetical protein IJ867_06650 [Clostridia bacterium]|nr:hypothetical protein [Clostridia bacterium]